MGSALGSNPESSVPASKPGFAESRKYSLVPEALVRGTGTYACGAVGWGLSQGRGPGAPLGQGGPTPSPPALPGLRRRGAVQPQCQSWPPPRLGREQRSCPPAPLPAPSHPAPPRRGRSTASRGLEPTERLPAGALNGAAGPGPRGRRAERRPRTAAAGGAAVRGCGGSWKPRAAGAVSAPGRPMA